MKSLKFQEKLLHVGLSSTNDSDMTITEDLSVSPDGRRILQTVKEKAHDQNITFRILLHLSTVNYSTFLPDLPTIGSNQRRQHLRAEFVSADVVEAIAWLQDDSWTNTLQILTINLRENKWVMRLESKRFAIPCFVGSFMVVPVIACGQRPPLDRYRHMIFYQIFVPVFPTVLLTLIRIDLVGKQETQYTYRLPQEAILHYLTPCAIAYTGDSMDPAGLYFVQTLTHSTSMFVFDFASKSLEEVPTEHEPKYDLENVAGMLRACHLSRPIQDFKLVHHTSVISNKSQKVLAKTVSIIYDLKINDRWHHCVFYEIWSLCYQTLQWTSLGRKFQVLDDAVASNSNQHVCLLENVSNETMPHSVLLYNVGTKGLRLLGTPTMNTLTDLAWNRLLSNLSNNRLNPAAVNQTWTEIGVQHLSLV